MLRSGEYVCGSLRNSHWCPCEICIQREVIPTGTANLTDWIKATERPVCPEKGSKTIEIRPEGVASHEAGSVYRALYDHCRPFQIIQHFRSINHGLGERVPHRDKWLHWLQTLSYHLRVTGQISGRLFLPHSLHLKRNLVLCPMSSM